MTSLMKKSVLIVDDYENWREFLTELIEDEYNVTTVADFEQARQALRNQIPPFHVAVMDVRLVDNDKTNKGGLDLFYQEIRTKGKYTNVIIVTGYDSESTKEVVNLLEAYAYVLKYPPEGEFNRAEYKRLVRAAAENAEKKRSGIRILIIEQDEALRNKLTDILQREHYNVEGVATPDIFLSQPENQGYSLLLINANLLSEDEYEDFEDIHLHEPNAKIIVTTDEKLGVIIRAIQRREVESAVTVSANALNEPEFKETIRSALTFESTKYVAARIDGVHGDWKLQTEQRYTLVLQLQKKYEQGTMKLWLPDKPTATQLFVKVDAPKITIQPEGKIPWNIPPSQEIPPSVEIELLPQVHGKITMTIDIQHGDFWMGRLEKEIEIAAKSSF